MLRLLLTCHKEANTEQTGVIPDVLTKQKVPNGNQISASLLTELSQHKHFYSNEQSRANRWFVQSFIHQTQYFFICMLLVPTYSQ